MYVCIYVYSAGLHVFHIQKRFPCRLYMHAVSPEYVLQRYMDTSSQFTSWPVANKRRVQGCRV